MDIELVCVALRLTVAFVENCPRYALCEKRRKEQRAAEDMCQTVADALLLGLSAGVITFLGLICRGCRGF